MLVQSLGLGEIGEQVVHVAYKKIDKNGNGKLDWNEALAAIELVKAIFNKSDEVSAQEQEEEKEQEEVEENEVEKELEKDQVESQKE